MGFLKKSTNSYSREKSHLDSFVVFYSTPQPNLCSLSKITCTGYLDSLLSSYRIKQTHVFLISPKSAVPFPSEAQKVRVSSSGFLDG